jgi:integrase
MGVNLACRSTLIRLGAHTGARIEELCGLSLDRVTDDRFVIEESKTEAGHRIIPLHSAITERVHELKATSSDGYLLSGLTFNKYGDRSNAIGKRFGRLRTALGYGSAYVFHSFRKGVATQLEQRGIPENEAARLLGHEFYTMSYGLYSGGALPFDRLKDVVEALDWS